MNLKPKHEKMLNAFIAAYERHRTYCGQYMLKFYAQEMNVSPQNAKYHLKVLADYGFIRRRIYGHYEPTELGVLMNNKKKIKKDIDVE